MRPAAQVERLKAHIREQGFYIVDEDPDAETRARHPMLIQVSQGEFGYPAARTSMDLPISRTVLARFADAFDVEPVALPK